MADQKACERALEMHADKLCEYPNVVGLGIDKDRGGEHRVAVYVAQKLPLAQLATEEVIPEMLEIGGTDGALEVRTRVIEQGPVALESLE